MPEVNEAPTLELKSTYQIERTLGGEGEADSMGIYLGVVKDSQGDDFVSKIESNQPVGSFKFDQTTGELTVDSSVEQDSYILTMVLSDLNKKQPLTRTYSFKLIINDLDTSTDEILDFQPITLNPDT